MSAPHGNDPRAQCLGKAQFETRALAGNVIRRWTATGKARGNRRGEHVRPYRCPHCGFYHIGSSPT